MAVTGLDKRRLALGDQLRELRRASGLSGKLLAHRAGWPASKVSRIENARQAVTDSDVRIWCEVTGAAPALAELLRDQLRSLRLDEAATREARRRAGRADAAGPGKHRDIGGHRAIEQRAGTIRIVELAMVPILVQTAEYAHHVLAAGAAAGSPGAQVGVQAWMERQRVLYAPGKRIEITLTESALRHPVCPRDVLCAQLDRLLALQGLPGMRLGVIPLDTRLPVLPVHGFWLLDDVVVTRTLTREVLVRDRAEVSAYRRHADALDAAAVHGEQVRTLLTGLMSRVGRG